MTLAPSIAFVRCFLESRSVESCGHTGALKPWERLAVSESLHYVMFEKLREKGGSGLVFQLTGGGAAQHFNDGMKAEDVIYKLRHLADLLEQGIKARATHPTPAEGGK